MLSFNIINDEIKIIESLVDKNKGNISSEDFERIFGFIEYLKKDVKIFNECYEDLENKYFDTYQMLFEERKKIDKIKNRKLKVK